MCVMNKRLTLIFFAALTVFFLSSGNSGASNEFDLLEWIPLRVSIRHVASQNLLEGN